MLLVPLVVAALSAGVGVAVVRVSVADERGARASGNVLAEPLGTPDNGSAVRTAVATGGSTALTLEPGVWSLRASAEKRWGEPKIVHVQAGAPQDAIPLTLWPVARLTGRLLLPAGQAAPERVTLRLHRELSPSTFARAQPLDSVACPVHDLRWSCAVPATMPLDIELEAPSLARAYLWRVRAGAGATLDTGEQRLFRGASVAGWIAPAPGNTEPPALVQLKAPDGAPVKSAPGDAWQVSATADARGFFQLGPLPPGTYHVAATRGAALSEPTQVRLTADAEERLRDVLELRPPAALRLSLDPPLDPDGKPWRVRLLAPRGQHSGHVVVGGEAASEDGAWSKAGLPAGPYRVIVLSASGNTWHDRTLELVPGANVERLALGALRVEGTLSLGSDPLAGRVRLRDEGSGAQARMQANEEGDFSGFFPAVDLEGARWAADVDATEPPLRRSLYRLRPERGVDGVLRFDVQLGAGVIEGTVVDERGAPAAAVVWTEDHDTRQPEGGADALIETRASAADGTFRIVGLTPGEHRVHATGAKPADGGHAAVSDVVAVDVPAREPAHVRLVLADTRNIVGRVVTPSGAGVAGATVIVVPTTARELLVRPRTTDAAGRFDARVPQDTRRVDVSVAAVGVGRRTAVLPLPEQGDLRVELDPAAMGTLVFEWDAPTVDLESAFVLHDGALDSPRELARWADIHAQPSAAGVLRVPLIAPGTYAVCRVRGVVELPALLAGSLPQGRCRAGQLAPGGELRLQVPPPVTVAAGTP